MHTFLLFLTVLTISFLASHCNHHGIQFDGIFSWHCVRFRFHIIYDKMTLLEYTLMIMINENPKETLITYWIHLNINGIKNNLCVICCHFIMLTQAIFLEPNLCLQRNKNWTSNSLQFWSLYLYGDWGR